MITAYCVVKGGQGGREGGKKCYSNRAGKGIGTSDCNSDVRGKRNPYDECDGWIPLFEKRRNGDRDGSGRRDFKSSELCRIERMQKKKKKSEYDFKKERTK